MNNSFELEFAQLSSIIKSGLNETKELQLKRTLLKLNNPNFYSKFTRTHPMHEYGYYTTKTINPILISIKNMLNIIKTDTTYSEKTKKIQEEFSWAYHEYQKSVGFFRKAQIKQPVN